MFFIKNPNLKEKYFFRGGGRGDGVVVGEMDGQMNRPKPIFPFNFFKVGGITMH